MNDTERKQFRVSGMHCASCALTLESALKSLPGVKQVKISPAAEEAVVDFDPKRVSVSQLRQAVAEEGNYRLIAEDEFPRGQVRYHGRSSSSNGGYSGNIKPGHVQILERDELRRLKFGAIFGVMATVGILILSFYENLGFKPPTPQIKNSIFLALTLLAQLVLGVKFYKSAFTAARRLRVNTDTLIAIGSIAAFFFGAGIVLFPRIFAGLETGAYFYAAAVILTLSTLGKYLEGRMKADSRDAVEKLSRPQLIAAPVISAGAERDAPRFRVAANDELRAGHEEKAPIAGVVNRQARLVQNPKAPIQHLADELSAYFAPAVIVIAIISGTVWYFFGPEPRAVWALLSFMTVLIIACPDTLGLAAPIAVSAAAGRAAAFGILFRDAEALERAAKVDYVVFGKTGILTLGKPEVTDVLSNPFSPYTPKLILQIAASAERGFEHALGESVSAAAKSQNLSLITVSHFRALPGLGLEAVLDGKKILFGSKKFMQREAVAINALREKAETLSKQGKSVMFLAVEGEFAGIIAAADLVKPDSRDAVARLHKQGVSVAMLTGNDSRTARAVAEILGIERVIAEVSPEDRALEVKKLRREHRAVAFAGNSAKDAPALAAADIGIAMGSNTGRAFKTAGIVLMNSSPQGVLQTMRLAKKTLAVIRGNLFWAFAYNIIGIPFAAGVFYLFFGLLLSPVGAAAAAVFSSLFVIGNSWRLKTVKL